MKRTLKEGYAIIPAGEQIVQIIKVDDTDYAKFDKIVVHLKDADGATSRENFNFVDKDGDPNPIVEGIYSRMCRAALNDQTLDECDSEELIGKFVLVEIEHKEGSKGGTFANIKKWIGPADGFEKTTTKPKPETKATSAMERLAALKAKK